MTVPDDDVAQALHWWLRGESYASIGRRLGLHHQTATELVRQAYAELAPVRATQLSDMKRESVERMRAIQRQAWADHDADEEREVALLEAALSGAMGGEGQAAVRFQSQRSQYLRVILEAEREIGRIEGVYDEAGAGGELAGAYLLRIERVVAGDVARVEQIGGAESGAVDAEGERDEERDAAAER